MRILKKYFPMSAKGWLIYFVAMGLASALCALLQRVSTSDVHVPMIFVLMVLIIALMTDGYFYGFLAAVTSVIAVNWAFTYPYAELNFSIYGYPLTFVTMLAVGFAVSTLAARVKEQNRIKLEAEQEKMRANLLRAISHDLRTPLTSISGAISAVLDSGDSLSNAQRLELLSDARKDADWLYRMVENLLSITRISGDKPGAIKKEDEVLEEVLSEVVVKFKKKNPDIAVSVTVPDDLFFVPMDAMLVEQLLMNLMDNAVEACSQVASPFIRLEAGLRKDYLVVTESNPTPADDTRKKRRIPQLERGIGLHILTDLAGRYHGSCTQEVRDRQFTVSIALQLPENQGETEEA